jgi:hypothetical protein
MEPCADESIFYGPLQLFSIRTGSRAFVGFKKVLGCSPYNLWKPDAGYKFFAAHFRRFLPDLPCNSIFRPWRRAYDAFFSFSFVKNRREEIPGKVQGFASSSGSLASIFELILGGLLYEVLDGSAFLIAGLVIYTAFLLNFRLRRFEKEVRY